MMRAPMTPDTHPEIEPGNLRVSGYWTSGACMWRVEKMVSTPPPPGHGAIIVAGCSRAWAMQTLADIEADHGGQWSHKGFQLLVRTGGCSDPDEPPGPTF